MSRQSLICEEVAGLYRVVRLKLLRRTPGVIFDLAPMELLPRIDGIDRVLHAGGACSPGAVGDVARPWYMHPNQADNLMVLHGIRHVELYTPGHGRIESFVVTPEGVSRDGKPLCDGPAMLVWPCNVFHRIHSDEQLGSASVNFAVRTEGFDIKTNFNIYDLDPASGKYETIRLGYLDQPDDKSGGDV